MSWSFTDHLGTPLLPTSALQGIVWRAEHEPYGSVYALRSYDRHQPLRLPGQEAEQLGTGANGVTERSYNVHRWYRAGWGRYESFDPAWSPRRVNELNPYAYVLNNPIRLTDTFGLAVERCCRPSHLPLIGGAALHCWVKTSVWQAGQQQDPNDPSRIPFFNSTVIADHSREKGGDIRCTPVNDIDEKCVNDFLAKNMGAPLGSFPQQTCHDFVNNLFRRCRRHRCESLEIPPAASWSLQ